MYLMYFRGKLRDKRRSGLVENEAFQQEHEQVHEGGRHAERHASSAGGVLRAFDRETRDAAARRPLQEHATVTGALPHTVLLALKNHCSSMSQNSCKKIRTFDHGSTVFLFPETLAFGLLIVPQFPAAARNR